MKKIVFSVMFVAALFGPQAFATKEVGNGGDAVVCANSVTMLDYFEAIHQRDLPLSLGAPSFSYQDKLQLLIDRVNKKDKGLGTFLAAGVKNFLSDVGFVTDASLVHITDVETIIIPDGCQIEQIAIHQDSWT